MNIVKHLVDLLYEEDCVVIPDFGGFILSHQPSSINDKLNIFIPALKSISFNSLLVKDDGLLISRVAAAEDVKYNEAKKQVALFTAMLNRKLKLREVVNIPNIGYFYLDEENNVNFIAYAGYNYNADSFGMGNFYLAPATVKTVIKIQEEDNKSVVAHKPIPIIRKLKYASVAAAIVAFAVISFKAADISFRTVYQATIIPNTEHKPQQVETKIEEESTNNICTEESVPEVEAIVTEVSDETVKLDVTKLTETEIVAEVETETATATATETTDEQLTIVPETISVDVDSQMFIADYIVEPSNLVQTPYVIVASLYNAEDAMIELKRIMELGYTEAVIVKSEKKYRIAVSGTTTHKNLDSTLKDAQKNISPAAWILYY